MKYKPYRILNDAEINMLTAGFEHILTHWNTQYARFPLSCRLEKLLQEPFDALKETIVTFTEHHHILACIPKQDVSCIQYALFGDKGVCFETSATTLFYGLIQSLLRAPSASCNPNSGTQHSDWFYRGSPSLALSLFHADQSVTFYLHPHWVLNALAKPPAQPQRLAPLDHALAETVLRCQVELQPIQLPLRALLALKPGDVIQTDHLLGAPLRLQHQDQTLCQVEIGKQLSHKSIQIKGSL